MIGDSESERHGWSPMALVAAVCSLLPLWLSLYVAHPDVGSSLRFMAYVLAFNLLPGLSVMRRANVVSRDTSLLLLLALNLGIIANLFFVTVLWALDLLWLLPALPIIAGAALLLDRRRPGWGIPLVRWRGSRTAGSWVAIAFFLCLTGLLGTANVLAGDPGDGFSFHSAFQGILVRGLEQGWPPPNLLLPNMHLSYNYGAHLWVLGVAEITGLPIDALVARYAPVFLGMAAAAAMFVTGRQLLGLPGWAAGLAMMCAFWIVGIPPVAGAIFGTFMPFGATLLLSPFLAFTVFFVTLHVLVAESRRGLPARLLALFVLVFLATGARGVVPPLLICAVCFDLLWMWRIRGAFPRNEALHLTAMTAGFVGGLVVFFTLGSGFSGTGFLTVTGQPVTFLTSPDQYLLTLPHLLMGAGFSPLLAGLLGFAVIAVFQAGFLTPALPWGLRGATHRDGKAIRLMAGCGLAGICAVFLTTAPGYSHFSFLYFANACLSLLASRGLVSLLAGHGMTRTPARIPVLCGIAILMVVHLAQLRGPALNWLTVTAPRIAAGLIWPDAAREASPAAACRHTEDAALFADAIGEHGKPIVIFLPAVPTGSFYCETMWLVVGRPIQTVSNYALTFVPGRASDGLSGVLNARASHMAAAMGLSARGVLSVADILALRRTLDPATDVFVMADQALVPDNAEGVIAMGVTSRFKLWYIP